MVRAKRVKRDSVTHIYQTCKQAGTCPPDVVNKVEQSTVADNILKYGSAAVFFGGLGIGTGRGTGGTTGYVPLGEGPGVRVGNTPTVVRPSIIPETIGPTDITPVDTINPIDPTASSIVPLTEAPSVDLLPGEVETIAEIHPLPEAPSTDSPVVTTSRGSSAVLEVAPEPTPPTRVRVSRSQYHNPSFQIITESTPTQGESSLADHVLVTSGSGGQIIGGSSTEAIELQELPSRYTFEIEEPTPPRRSSTPIQRPSNVRRGRGPSLTNRRLVQQVQVENPLFLSQPSRLVRFAFDNPVFEEEVTNIFEQDVNEFEEPPDRDFLDVAKLGRPQYSETPAGYVRVSRLGQRQTIRTRSGASIGSQVHFYRDLSTINTEEPIELQLLGQHSGDATIVQGPSAESTFIDMDLGVNPISESEEAFSHDLLLDEAVEDFSGSQLVIGNRRSTVSYTVPRFETPRSASYYVQDTQGYYVAYPESRNNMEIIYPSPELPVVVIHTYDSTGDFYLHPSLTHKRRKRKYL